MFRLTSEEAARLRLQSATTKPGRGGSGYLPTAFTEHGAVMLASGLNSPIAVAAGIQLVRAFVQLRESWRHIESWPVASTSWRAGTTRSSGWGSKPSGS